jgi:cysteine-rich repeat protein
MKRLCLPELAHRVAAPALFAGALGLAAIAGCAGETPTGAGGGSSTTGSGEGGMATASSTATTSSTGGSGGGSSSASTSSVGGAGGTGGTGGATATSSSASSSAGTGGDGGMGGAPFMPPPGTAEYPAETEQNNLKSSANVLQMGTKGFTASLHPVGDVDVFEVDVTLGGSQLRAEITDGMGGCPSGATTYMRVFDKSGLLLAADKDSGAASCSLLLPADNPALQGLAVGQYYVQVENLSIVAMPFYVVDIKLTPPSCGDAVVQFPAGEQCDDGANVAGDGCSPTCQLEGLFGNEVEPNDTTGTANPIGANNGMVAAIGTSGDQDYYSFTVTVPGSSVALTIDDGLGTCPSGFDSKMYLFDASNNEIASDDESGDASCSAILPTDYPAVASLAVGTYYVRVEEYGNNDIAPFYVLRIKLQPPACGDGILQLGEQCDDGNLAAGDGCSPTCVLEGNFVTETEPNDTQATANPLGGADGFAASITPIGDQDYFSFDVVAPGSSAFIQVTDGLNGCPSGFDSKITLFNPIGALIATADDGGAAKCSLMSPPNTPATTNMAVGTYKVRVEYNGNSTQIASYVLKIKVVAPGCGDTVLQSPTEQCDDGNTTPGDGCNATCQAEPPYEIEPNGTLMTATPQWPGFSNWIGFIAPPDRDYFSFTLAAPGTVTLTVHSVNDAATCPGDTLLHLDNAAGAELTSDDDGGIFPCSSLNKALPAGTFYAWVQGYQDTKQIGKYQLDLTVN